MGTPANSTLKKTSDTFRPGVVVGRLTLIDSYLVSDKGRRVWNAQCSCGKTTAIRQDYLRKCLREGGLGSCGCLQHDVARASKNNLQHGMTATPTWNTWASMIRRCYDPKAKSYPAYGAKGITVCAAWRESFDAFFADMGERPEGMTLDRRNNDLGYCKENCRWATKLEQGRNTARNVFVTVRGSRRTLSEWAAVTGLSYYILKHLPRDTGELEAYIDAAIPRNRILRSKA